jgi:hypothetical protein
MQAFPHARQSVTVLSERHWPPHSAEPAAQAHAPARHCVPPLHVAPHAPQFATSVEVSVHRPPQTVCPTGQAQAPATQLAPWAQRLPQVPQFAVVCRYEAWRH